MPQLGYTALLCCLQIWTLTAGTDNDYPLKSVDQCYGKRIPVVCDAGHMVRVVSAQYRQSPVCVNGYHSNLCQKEEPGNPACVGNQTCVFTTPWMYLSATCGYSNNFLLEYRCIPRSLQHDVCQTTTLSTPSGYLLSPSYPRQYTTTARQCAATVTVPIGQRIRFTLLDLYLAYYRQDREIKCLDKLWISDGVEISDVFCSGQQRGLVFTSRANQATVYFESSDHKFRNAKGFWLYYEGTNLEADPQPALATRPVQQLTDLTLPSKPPKPPTPTITMVTAVPSTVDDMPQLSPNSIQQTSHLVSDNKAVRHPDTLPQGKAPQGKEWAGSLQLTPGKVTPWYWRYTRTTQPGSPSPQLQIDVIPTDSKDDSQAIPSLFTMWPYINATVGSKSPRNPNGKTQIEDLWTGTSHTSSIPPVTTEPEHKFLLQEELQPLSFQKVYAILKQEKLRKRLMQKLEPSTPDPRVKHIAYSVEPPTTTPRPGLPTTPPSPSTNHSNSSFPSTPSIPPVSPDPLPSPEGPQLNQSGQPQTAGGLPSSLARTQPNPADGGLVTDLTFWEIGAITGGAAGLLLLIVSVSLTTVFIKRKRVQQLYRQTRSGLAKKLPYKDVIMAYATESPPSPGMHNLVFDADSPTTSIEDFSIQGDSSYRGSGGGGEGMDTIRSWRALMPIDETLEDLYTEVKRCSRYFPRGSANPAMFVKGKSKSMDDLAAKRKKKNRERARMFNTLRPDMSSISMSLSMESLESGASGSPHAGRHSTPDTSLQDLDYDQAYYQSLGSMYSDLALAQARAHTQQVTQQPGNPMMPSNPYPCSPANRNVRRHPECYTYEATFLDRDRDVPL